VVTIPSNTSIVKAKKVMVEKGMRRLPVVDKGKLIGMVEEHQLEKVMSRETGRSMWEISYTFGELYRTRVKEIVQTNVVTVTPSMTVEEALALAQSKKVGALVVVEDGKVVGIVTANDFSYRIVNKVLGVGEPGERMWVAGGGEGKVMEKIIATINKRGWEIITLHIIAPPRKTKKDLVIHINSDDVSDVVTELRGKGYEVSLRKR
jgi:acetoin utilization protein AcuB